MTSTSRFDGHYWVVRDGVIIDPIFEDYTATKSIFGLKGRSIYLPADALTQQVFKKKLTDHITKLETEGYRFPNDWEIAYGHCDLNAYTEQKLRGGEIVFGSMGWKRKNGNGVHYEYGGEGWNVAKFRSLNPHDIDYECMKVYGKKDRLLEKMLAAMI
tara:strand:+ start:85 stop:558 length:474 start_codon:yes stop_codon:yes gene_type:complete